MALPTAQDLRELLAVMRESGARRVKLGDLEAEFPPADDTAPVATGAPLVDAEGKPADLDDGMPTWNTQDPIASANFPQPPKPSPRKPD